MFWDESLNGDLESLVSGLQLDGSFRYRLWRKVVISLVQGVYTA